MQGKQQDISRDIKCNFLAAYTGSKFNSNFRRRATCTGSTTSIAATYHNPTMSNTYSENAKIVVENSDGRCSAAPSDGTGFLNTSKLDLMEIYWVGIWWESKCCTMQVEKSKGSWAKLFWKVYVHFRMEYIHLWQGTKYNSFLGWDSRKKMCREGLCQNLVLVMDAKSAVVDPIWISFSRILGAEWSPNLLPDYPSSESRFGVEKVQGSC